MSGLCFRNIDASPGDPVESWPLEAIQTALERGSLQHWRRLAAAIKAQPWGSVARDLEEILSYSRPYGVAKTMERVMERARNDAEAAERDAVATEVRQLIDDSGLSRPEFAYPLRHLNPASLHLRNRQGRAVGSTPSAPAICAGSEAPTVPTQSGPRPPAS